MSEKFFMNFNLKMPILKLYINESPENSEISNKNNKNFNTNKYLICDSNTHFSYILEKVSEFYERP